MTIPTKTAQIVAGRDLLQIAKAASGVEVCAKLIHMHVSATDDNCQPPLSCRILGQIGDTLEVLSFFIAEQTERVSKVAGTGDHWGFHKGDVFDPNWTPPDAREERGEEATP